MPVTKVTETWVGVEGDDNSLLRQFEVTFDKADPPAYRPIAAKMASDPASGLTIPHRLQQHPHSLYFFVDDRRVKMAGPFHFLVTVYYRRGENLSNQPVEDPFDEPWEEDWGFARRTDVVDRDIAGDPIVNSAGQSYNPPVPREYYDNTLTIVRNQPFYNAFQARAFMDAVNADNFYGFEKGAVKCTDFSGRKMRLGADFHYYRVRYAFAIRKHWLLELKDEGLAERKNNANGTFNSWEIIKDFYSERMSEPVPLDGHGHPQSPDAPIVINKWEINHYARFALLALEP